MIALPVVTEAQVKAKLQELHYSPTDNVTATGRFWKHKDGKRHLMVPFSADGYYPDWLLEEVVQRARAIGAVHKDRDGQKIVAHLKLAAGEDRAGRDRELMRTAFAAIQLARLVGVVIQRAAARANRLAFRLGPTDQPEGFRGFFVRHARNLRQTERTRNS